MLINICLLCFGLEWLLEWWQWSKLMEDSSALGLACAGFYKFSGLNPGSEIVRDVLSRYCWEVHFFIIRGNPVFFVSFTTINCKRQFIWEDSLVGKSVFCVQEQQLAERGPCTTDRCIKDADSIAWQFYFGTQSCSKITLSNDSST